MRDSTCHQTEVVARRATFRSLRLFFLAPLVVLAPSATPTWAGTFRNGNWARFDAERPRSIEALSTTNPAASDPTTTNAAAKTDGSILKAGLAGVARNLPGPAKSARRDSAGARVDEAAAELIRAVQDPRPDVVLAQVERLLVAKARVDAAGLAELFSLRELFRRLAIPARRLAAAKFCAITCGQFHARSTWPADCADTLNSTS